MIIQWHNAAFWYWGKKQYLFWNRQCPSQPKGRFLVFFFYMISAVVFTKNGTVFLTGSLQNDFCLLFLTRQTEILWNSPNRRNIASKTYPNPTLSEKLGDTENHEFVRLAALVHFSTVKSESPFLTAAQYLDPFSIGSCCTVKNSQKGIT